MPCSLFKLSAFAIAFTVKISVDVGDVGMEKLDFRSAFIIVNKAQQGGIVRGRCNAKTFAFTLTSSDKAKREAQWLHLLCLLDGKFQMEILLSCCVIPLLFYHPECFTWHGFAIANLSLLGRDGSRSNSPAALRATCTSLVSWFRSLFLNWWRFRPFVCLPLSPGRDRRWDRRHTCRTERTRWRLLCLAGSSAAHTRDHIPLFDMFSRCPIAALQKRGQKENKLLIYEALGGGFKSKAEKLFSFICLCSGACSIFLSQPSLLVSWPFSKGRKSERRRSRKYDVRKIIYEISS